LQWRLQAGGEKVPQKVVEEKNGASTDHEQIVPESLTAQNIVIRSRTIYRQWPLVANKLLG
jgi:hypothetical protein